MSVFNKTLWILIISFILIPILLLHAKEPLEYTENISNLHYEGSDTYQDGKTILLFTQRNNETNFINTKFHMCIIFVNRTVLSIEIDYGSLPFDFIPKCEDGNSFNSFDCNILLTPKALIDGYVLIESRLGQLPHREIIVSWNGIIHKTLNLRKNYQVAISLDSKQEFLITEIQNTTMTGFRRFTVQNPNDLNSAINEEIGTFSISKNATIYKQNIFSLVEGGFATIIFSVTKFNDIIKQNEIHIRFYKSNNRMGLSKQYLLYPSIADEISQAIPIDPKRLKNNEKIQIIQINDTNLTLISIIITPPSSSANNNEIEENTNSELKDQNELIRKEYNLLSNGNIAKFFEETYNAHKIRRKYFLWKIFMLNYYS
ncbi:hypothetical protein C1645_811032 [Glomus cerebriforme]|uniref:Uncharacterized protein n=1 Tax=Glomus cerebriforme TaxID=658196 RepID=A0A397TXX0_9GLOM|nr:hypothetical protein C1645_811032 [Glomus cerebriforme]